MNSNATYETTDAQSKKTWNRRNALKLLVGKLPGGLNHFTRAHVILSIVTFYKKGKRKVQGVPQSQTAALPRSQEEEKTDKSKQAQTEQTYERY